MQQIQETSSQPTESSQAQKRKGLMEGDNPILTVSLDAFQEALYQACETNLFLRTCPIETFHTILLGP